MNGDAEVGEGLPNFGAGEIVTPDRFSHTTACLVEERTNKVIEVRLGEGGRALRIVDHPDEADILIRVLGCDLKRARSLAARLDRGHNSRFPPRTPRNTG